MLTLFSFTFNIWAVIAAAAVNMVLGFLWYSDMMFGKQWMKLMGIHPTKEEKEKMQKTMGPAMGIMLVSSLIMAYVLDRFVHMAMANTLLEGAKVGLWAWLGFVATTMLSSVLFGKKPLKLYYIDTGYYLVLMLINGAILARWV